MHRHALNIAAWTTAAALLLSVTILAALNI